MGEESRSQHQPEPRMRAACTEVVGIGHWALGVGHEPAIPVSIRSTEYLKWKVEGARTDSVVEVKVEVASEGNNYPGRANLGFENLKL